MEDTITLTMTKAEAAHLEAFLDDYLQKMRVADAQLEQATRSALEQIKAALQSAEQYAQQRDRRQFEEELAKLDPAEEKAWADLGLASELEQWPTY